MKLSMLCLSESYAYVINEHNLHLQPYHQLFGFNFQIKNPTDTHTLGYALECL